MLINKSGFRTGLFVSPTGIRSFGVRHEGTDRTCYFLFSVLASQQCCGAAFVCAEKDAPQEKTLKNKVDATF